MKKVILLMLLFSAGYAQFVAHQVGARKTWGPVRGVYVDPSQHDVRLVFEDAAGTIRICTVDTAASDVNIVSEIERK